MDDLEKAILVGYDPTADNDSKARAATYCGQVCNSADGWKQCLEKVFVAELAPVRFSCLGMLIHITKHRYEALGPEEKSVLKASLLRWMAAYAPEHAATLETATKAKFAQLLAHVFLQEYPANWPDFFSSLAGALSTHPVVVELFLRLLDGIDEVVVSHEYHRTPADVAAANAIKDQMRAECVGQFADIWYNVLSTCQQSHPLLVQLALKNIKQYIVWIDINLIVNERFLAVFFALLGSNVTEFREGACETLESIASKGMGYQHKIDLLLTLRAHELIANIKTDDIEFQEKLAKLLNKLGLESIDCRSNAHRERAPPAVIAKAEQLVENSIQLTITYMANEYDDTSAQVLPFVGHYLHKLRHADPLSEKQLQHLQQFLAVIAKKVKYEPSCFNFEVKGDDEKAFEDYRQELIKCFLKIYKLQTAATQQLMFQNLRTLLTSDCTRIPMPELEGVLQLFYSLRTVDNSNNDFYKAVMALIMQSNVARHEHFEVPLLVYDIVVRYSQCLPRDPGSIIELLKAFLDERGVRHRLPRVRGRVSYQFKRIVNEFAGDLQHLECSILESLMPLLALNVDQNMQFLTDSDLEHLYEAAGVLAYGLRDNSEKHQVAVAMVSAVPLKTVEQILVQEEYRQDTPENPRYCRLLIRSLSVTGRFTKGFKQCTPEATAVLKQALDLNMLALQKLKDSDEVRKYVMIFFHGIIEMVGKDIFSYLPVALAQLLQSITGQDMQAFLRLLNQLVARFKGDIEVLINGGFSSIVERLFYFHDNVLEEESDKRYLERQYFLFLNTIANNRIAKGVLLSAENQALLPQVMQSVFAGCAGATGHIKNVKTCLTIVELLCTQWIGQVEGFEQLVLQNVGKIFFEFPLGPSYKANDADCFIAFISMARIAQILLRTFPDAFLAAFGAALAVAQCPPDWLQSQFVPAFQQKQKALAKFLMRFFEDRRKVLGVESAGVS
mmetsp:Transcript_15783/g.61661  ORF Transcript_15783/g.61661 Transcript_15783/m.61661 type:complete len:954 (+) Transcript_15783:303-3164(+)